MSEFNMTESRREVLTVSDVTTRVKQLLEREVGRVWVQGELSNFRVAPSGHAYGTLKDRRSQIRIVAFRNTLGAVGFMPEDGMKILIGGRVTVYEARGDYQIVCEHMSEEGEGAAAVALRQLREKLTAEGIFDPGIKRPLPFLPLRIGVVTSPTGAALRDVLHVLARRYENVHVLISPCKVQGADAPGEIISALGLLGDVADLDVLLVTRGGGSAEDLSAFNHEAVVRAIAAARVPVVCAIGHEIDWTLSDLAADQRAATPSAAAEILVREKAALEEKVEALDRRLTVAAGDRIGAWRQRVLETGRRLVHPRKRIEQTAQRLDDLGDRLERAAAHLLVERRRMLDAARGKLHLLAPGPLVREGREAVGAALSRLASNLRHRLGLARSRMLGTLGRLDSLSPLAVLGRGYSITRALPAQRIVRRTEDAPPGTRVEITLRRGVLRAEVRSTKSDIKGPGNPGKR